MILFWMSVDPTIRDWYNNILNSVLDDAKI